MTVLAVVGAVLFVLGMAPLVREALAERARRRPYPSTGGGGGER